MISRKLLILLALPLGVVLATVLHSGTAHADPFARGAKVGYFYGESAASGHNIFGYGTYAIPQSDINNNVDNFTNFYWGKLNDGNMKDYIGASFTILTMLGYPIGTDPSVAVSQFNYWSSIVHYYAAQGRIGWYVNYGFDYNTYYMDPQNPTYPNGDVGWYSDPGASAISIVFYNPDGTTSYAIKTDCANPVGNMTPLSPPPTEMSCGSVTTDINPEVGRQMTVSATINITSGPVGPPANEVMNVTQQGGGTSNIFNSSSRNGNTVTLTGKFTPSQAGWYTITWTATVNGYSPDPNPCGGDFKLYSSFDVLDYPFFSVKSGDVVSGAAFGTGTVPCSSGSAPHNLNAGISTWNDSGNPDYNGAGSQYAAMAMNYLQGFITNQGQGPPSSMAFANTGQAGSYSPGQELWGGMFGGVTSCVDYWDKKPSLSSLPSLGSSTTLQGLNGTYKYIGTPTNPLIINGSAAQDSIPDNTHLTIYVDGNVEIKTPITYSNSNGWGSEDAIPSLRLIVHGSIFIDPSVGQLDGVYVAVPDHYYPGDPQTTANNFTLPQAGTITTCAVPGTSPLQSYNPTLIGSNNMTATCGNPLTVNGAFVANQLYLLRTYGTRATNQPAETFRLGPEDWVSPSQSTVPSTMTYQSFTSLPPVL